MKNRAHGLSGLKAILLAGLLLQSASSQISSPQSAMSPQPVTLNGGADAAPLYLTQHQATQHQATRQHTAQQSLQQAAPLISQLQTIGQLLQQQQWQQLPVAWLHSEQAWQQLYTQRTQLSTSHLFAAHSANGLSAAQLQQQLNKIYNRLQLAYLLFQQQQDANRFHMTIKQAQQDLQRLLS